MSATVSSRLLAGSKSESKRKLRLPSSPRISGSIHNKEEKRRGRMTCRRSPRPGSVPWLGPGPNSLAVKSACRCCWLPVALPSDSQWPHPGLPFPHRCALSSCPFSVRVGWSRASRRAPTLISSRETSANCSCGGREQLACGSC